MIVDGNLAVAERASARPAFLDGAVSIPSNFFEEGAGRFSFVLSNRPVDEITVVFIRS